ncbi:MAG: MMPL family transporter [Bacteroidales bacterium]|nr:MMPL family transporter [Bacteroidales bacterium]
MSEIITSLFDRIQKSRIIFILLMLGILGLSVFFASKIRFEEDITKMLPSDKNIAKINLVSQNLNFADKLVISISLSDTNSIATPEKLIGIADQLYSELTALQPDYISEITYSVSENIISDVYDIYLNNLPIFLEEDDYIKIDSLLSQSAIEKAIKNNYKTLISPASMVMKQFVIKDPLHLAPIALNRLSTFQVDENHTIYQGKVFTKDHKNLTLFLSTAYPSSETNKNGVLIKKLDQLIDSLNNGYNNEYKIQYYGAAAVAVGNANRIKTDISVTLSIAVIGLIIFLSLFFRKKSIFFLIFLPALLGGTVAVAAMFLIKGKVSVISLAFGSVLLGITVDFSLHLFAHLKSIGSIRKVIKDIALPVMVSSTTTAFAFLCLLFVSSRALQDMGLFAAIAVFLAAIFSITVLPQLIKYNTPDNYERPPKNFIERFTSYQFENNNYVLFFILAFTIVSLFFTGKPTFENELDNMNYMSDKLKQAEKDLNRTSQVALKSVYLVSYGNNLQEALENSEKTLPKLDSLKQQKIINQYTSISAILISESLQNERIERWNNFWTQEKKNNIKNNIIKSGLEVKFKQDAFNSFFELLDKEFQPVKKEQLGNLYTVFVDDYVTIHDSITTVVNILKTEENLKPAVYSSFENQANNIVFDKKYMTNSLVKALKDDLNLLVNLSLLVVFGILLLSFGRIELAIITIIPMIISWIWTLGIMGMFNIHFTIFNIVISTFIFGLGDDYSIFIMRGLLQEYKYGEKNVESFKTSILLSVITTLVGIGVLIFAKHPALRSIALLSIIGIFSVIVISYTLIPFMVNHFLLTRKNKSKVAYSFQEVINSGIAWTIFIGTSVIVTIFGFILFKVFRLKNNWAKIIFNKSIVASSAFLFYGMFNIRKKIINPNKEKLKKPAIVICNHQSHIDLVYNLQISSKLIVLTNDWVQNSKIYGKIVQMADFYPVSEGYENLLPKLREKVKEGYSILVYPEGTRSTDLKMKRFHKGAFYLAEMLNLDIVPIIFHGTGYCMTKGDDLLVKNGTIYVRYLDRITPENKDYGSTYSERAKQIGKYMKNVYNQMRVEIEDTRYYRDKLIKNYIYKGPVLEWYLKVKLKLENNYELFNKLIPRKGKIYDIGCGYGYLSYILHFVSEERVITGIDYDEEKVLVANNCPSKNEKINFESADITKYQFEPADVFLLSDVLHYIPEQKQEELIDQMVKNLNDNGMIIIRDANTNLKERHKGTKFTEVFSTKIFGFNKTADESKQLYFVSEDRIRSIFRKYNMDVELIDETKHTSNVLYVIRKM